MERYRLGALAEAIGYWEPIYRELGDEKGYRLAYDLGVAYQELGDSTHAAERLQSFLAEVDARGARGEPLAPIVEKEVADARARVGRLAATKARIRVEAGTTPRAARVDASEPRLAGFVAWVTPGEHKVTFAAGTPEAQTKVIFVKAGEVVEVAPLPPVPLPAERLVVAPPPPASPEMRLVMRRETHHPFSWPLIAVTGGVTVAAAIAAVPLYGSVGSLYDRLSSENTISQGDRDNYTRMRTLAYSVMGGAIGLALGTAGLAAWYVLGTSEREVMVNPVLDPERRGASFTVTGRF
jgi:hypothetical protein